jgi:hypothetical protein
VRGTKAVISSVRQCNSLREREEEKTWHGVGNGFQGRLKLTYQVKSRYHLEGNENSRDAGLSL